MEGDWHGNEEETDWDDFRSSLYNSFLVGLAKAFAL